MSEKLLRGTLWFTFFYNIMGALMFFFPESLGALGGVPDPQLFLYSGFIGFNIFLFGLVGLWQARRKLFDAPVLVIFGISKISFCGLMLVSLLDGVVPLPAFLMSLVDFAMGVIFLLGAKAVQEGTLP